MKPVKRRMEIVSFFDHTGISEHLEKMAAKGWLIEKITNFATYKVADSEEGCATCKGCRKH